MTGMTTANVPSVPASPLWFCGATGAGLICDVHTTHSSEKKNKHTPVAMLPAAQSNDRQLTMLASAGNRTIEMHHAVKNALPMGPYATGCEILPSPATRMMTALTNVYFAIL